MRSLISQLSVLVTLGLIGMGCGHHATKYDSTKSQTSEVSAGQGLEAHVNWLKVKGDKIDVELVLSNTSNESVKVSADSIHIAYEGESGMLNQHGDFLNTLAAVNAHSTKSGPAYFTFKSKVNKEGNATITIDPIYASGSGDPNSTKVHWRKLAPIALVLPVKP